MAEAKGKRDATSDEIEKALRDNHDRWNRMNPDHEITMAEWRQKLAEADAEGYKSEVCRCGATFLSFHHFTSCSEGGCPFRSGASLLETLLGSSSSVVRDG